MSAPEDESKDLLEKNGAPQSMGGDNRHAPSGAPKSMVRDNRHGPPCAPPHVDTPWSFVVALASFTAQVKSTHACVFTSLTEAIYQYSFASY